MLVIAVLVVIALPACLAQSCYPPAEYAHLMFVDTDRDHDGIIHLTEMIDTFHVYDSNGDGRVSRQEYTSHQTAIDPTFDAMAHALYDVYDFNHDHHLEMDDYVAFYRSMDHDGNDSVAEAEFRSFWTHLLCQLGHHHNAFCLDTCQ